MLLSVDTVVHLTVKITNLDPDIFTCLTIVDNPFISNNAIYSFSILEVSYSHYASAIPSNPSRPREYIDSQVPPTERSAPPMHILATTIAVSRLTDGYLRPI